MAFLIAVSCALRNARVLVAGRACRCATFVRCSTAGAARGQSSGAGAGLPELVGVACVIAFIYNLVTRAEHPPAHGDIPIGGYLTVIGTGWYVSLGVIIVGIAFYTWRRLAGGVLFAGLQLVVAVFAVPILVYSTPRSQSAQKHIEIVQGVVAHHSLDGTLAIYKAWPGFFTAVAASLAGFNDHTDTLRLATYWPLLMALASFAVFASLARILGCNRVASYLVATGSPASATCSSRTTSRRSRSATCWRLPCSRWPWPTSVRWPRRDDALVPSRRHPGFKVSPGGRSPACS